MILPSHPNARSEVDPFTRSAPAKPAVNDREDDQERQKKFAQKLVNAIVPQVRLGRDRRDYYILRAEEARLLAEAAADQQIKIIHLEISARYHSLANRHLDRQTIPLFAIK